MLSEKEPSFSAMQKIVTFQLKKREWHMDSFLFNFLFGYGTADEKIRFYQIIGLGNAVFTFDEKTQFISKSSSGQRVRDFDTQIRNSKSNTYANMIII